MSTRLRMIVPAAMILVLLAWGGFGQGFGEPSGGFGESATEREYSAVDPQTGGGSTYFIHDQLLKTLLLAGFLVAGSAVVLTRRFRWRRVLLILSVGVLGFYVGGYLCPLSAVQNIVLKANTGYLILFLLPVLFSLILGRVFCGSVCPFGALQELLHVRRIALRISRRWRHVLRGIQWALLLFLFIHVLMTRVSVFDELTPFRAFFTFGGSTLALAVSGVFAILSLSLYRPFCRICPLGALLGLVSRIRLYGVGTTDRCVDCARCDMVCRFDAIRRGKVSSSDCLLCGDCLSSCPVHCLTLRAKPGMPRSDKR